MFYRRMKMAKKAKKIEDLFDDAVCEIESIDSLKKDVEYFQSELIHYMDLAESLEYKLKKAEQLINVIIHGVINGDYSE